MNQRFKSTLIALTAAALMGAPAYALAAPAQVAYTTTLQATDPASRIAYFYGSLQLTVGPDGLVHGWYQPQYGGSFTPVTGSYKDGKYWLTFGSGSFQVFATKQADGTIAGTATNSTIPSNGQSAPLASVALYPQTYQFVAKPTSD
ncbi:MAG TPA: hypothetical protein VEJ41_00675 [Candidatus Acidoferrales bacterium]|nr:hypothetical protein [Candidatus Acidoferrales bacterium]